MLSSQADAEAPELECESPIHTTEASGNIWQLAAEEGDLDELRYLEGFEFTAKHGEDPATTFTIQRSSHGPLLPLAHQPAR